MLKRFLLMAMVAWVWAGQALPVFAEDNSGGVAIVSGAAVAPVVIVDPVAPSAVANSISVSMAAPLSNAKFLPGATIELLANASISDGTIARVDFYSGTALIGSASAPAPFATSWANVPAGKYSITAKATDVFGFTKFSAPVSVTVNTPPTITLTSPAVGATFAGLATIAVTANAEDAEGGITKVEFYRSGTLIGRSVSPPYSATWVNAPPGSYAIAALVTDNLGGLTMTPATTIMVSNPIAVNIAAPISGTRFLPLSTIEVTANASDSNGMITRVDFYNGAALLGSATAAPYSFQWQNVAAGKYSLTAVATDSQGITAAASAVNIVVDNASFVNLLSPIHRANYNAPAEVTLMANAAASIGNSIAKVDFYSGGTLIGSASRAPYTVIWSNVAAGAYVITAKATDSLGSVISSSSSIIKVYGAPTVSLTAPAEHASFIAPAKVKLSADAAAATGSTVRQVAFYSGGAFLGSTSSAPYSLDWNVASSGSYAVTASVTDSVGGVANSAPVNVVVVANTPPVVSLTATPATAVAPKTITLAAEASDVDGGVATVEFYNGKSLLATLVKPPYYYFWGDVASGDYVVTAKATDSLGASTTSAPVNVSITSPATSVFYIHSDQLNTPRRITDSNSREVWRWEGAPFGTGMAIGAPGGGEVRFTFNLRFPGQYFDWESNLHYNYFRDYDPALGRYVQSDPIGLNGGINTYSYVGGNPVSNIDPDGLQVIVIHGTKRGPNPGADPFFPVPPSPGWTLPTWTLPDWASDWMESRSIPAPPRPKCGCTCTCRADANQNDPKNTAAFAFGTAEAHNCAEASKTAKRRATQALGQQPKHVGCRCTES